MKFVNEESKVVNGFAMIKEITEKETAAGKPYMDITFCDKEGSLPAKIWEANSLKLEATDIVKLDGKVEDYQGSHQIKVSSYRKATEADMVDVNDFVEAAPYRAEDMLRAIEKEAEAFSDEELKTLVKYFINENRDSLLIAPAATKMHHAVRGGLLFHTVSMMRTAKAIADVYIRIGYAVNRDMLLTGVILHDFAKIEEMNISPLGIASEYSIRGNLLGHLVMGVTNIDKAGNQLGINPEKLLLVEHMIASHHDLPEWGACKPTMTVEALILASVDVLDARMYEYKAEIDKVEPGTLTGKVFAAGNHPLYRPSF